MIAHQDQSDKSAACRDQVTIVTAVAEGGLHPACGRGMIRASKRGELRMHLPANDMLATSDALAKRELSTAELETVAAGVALMSGAPNSIQQAGFPREPHLPPHFPIPLYWAGGVQNSPGLRAFL
jgi:hypothetical protein